MDVRLYESHHGACPYLPDREWVTHAFAIATMPEGAYELLLEQGWRRSGDTFYRNRCPGCTCCTPIRVPVREFMPSRSQRRATRRNGDVRVETGPAVYDDDVYALYASYVRSRHPSDSEPTPQGFVHFLADAPLETAMMRYYVADRLVGAGWVDVLADGLSSVYFAFDPDEHRRSLGTYSVLREIEYADSLGLAWLYLGFYVPGSPKMEYKARFAPYEVAVNGAWTRDASMIDCDPSPRPG